MEGGRRVADNGPVRTGDQEGSLPPIDWADLAQRLGNRMTLACQILHTFVEQTPPQLDKLQAFRPGVDGEWAARTAHTLKGACANVSAPHLLAVACDLEAAVKQGDEPAVARQVAAARDELTRIEQALAAYERKAS